MNVVLDLKPWPVTMKNGKMLQRKKNIAKANKTITIDGFWACFPPLSIFFKKWNTSWHFQDPSINSLSQLSYAILVETWQQSLVYIVSKQTDFNCSIASSQSLINIINHNSWIYNYLIIAWVYISPILVHEQLAKQVLSVFYPIELHICFLLAKWIFNWLIN